jgi:large subunit ribosomal protein L24
MKNKFSKHWKESKQPRKQRKYIANAPLHIKRKLLGTNLSKELRKKYKKRTMIVVKGDTVKIMRGKFKNKQGKVLQVFTNKSKVTIENINVKKQDGSKANIKMWASNLQIIELNLNDKKRMKTTKEDSNKKTETKESKEDKK